MNAVADSLRRRWPAYALVASLVLNGFLAGALVTDALKPHRGFTGERFTRFELRRLDDRLPKDAVDAIAADLQSLGGAMEERVARLRAIREEIMQLASAPEPDRAAIDARLAALRDEASAMQEEVQRATYDSLLRLPPEMRLRLAQAPEER
jgi:hypothetical protein